MVPAEQVDDTIFTLFTVNSFAAEPEAEADGLAADGLSPAIAQLPVTSTVWPTWAARSTPEAAVSLTFLLAVAAPAAPDAADDGDEAVAEGLSCMPFLTLVSSKLLALVPAWMQPVSFVSLPARSADGACADGYGLVGEDGVDGVDGVDGGVCGVEGVCAPALIASPNMAAKQPAAILRVISISS